MQILWLQQHEIRNVICCCCVFLGVVPMFPLDQFFFGKLAISLGTCLFTKIKLYFIICHENMI